MTLISQKNVSPFPGSLPGLIAQDGKAKQSRRNIRISNRSVTVLAEVN